MSPFDTSAYGVYQVDTLGGVSYKDDPIGVAVSDSKVEWFWACFFSDEWGPRETAYVWPLADEHVPPQRASASGGARAFGMCFFAPGAELPLGISSMLAIPHVLWDTHHVPTDRGMWLHAGDEWLQVTMDDEGAWLDAPAYAVKPIDAPHGLAEALGAEPVSVHSSANGLWLVELASEAALRALEPDGSAGPLAERYISDVLTDGRGCPTDRHWGVIATAPSDGGHDYCARFFAPQVEVAEDHMGGIAQCCLGPFWARRLTKGDLVGEMVSLHKSVVRLRVRQDDPGRVHLRIPASIDSHILVAGLFF